MSRFSKDHRAGGFRLDSPAKLPVASEMPRCAPPHTLRAGEEPCRGGRGRQRQFPRGVPPGATSIVKVHGPPVRDGATCSRRNQDNCLRRIERKDAAFKKVPSRFAGIVRDKWIKHLTMQWVAISLAGHSVNEDLGGRKPHPIFLCLEQRKFWIGKEVIRFLGCVGG